MASWGFPAFLAFPRADRMPNRVQHITCMLTCSLRLSHLVAVLHVVSDRSFNVAGLLNSGKTKSPNWWTAAFYQRCCIAAI